MFLLWDSSCLVRCKNKDCFFYCLTLGVHICHEFSFHNSYVITATDEENLSKKRTCKLIQSFDVLLICHICFLVQWKLMNTQPGLFLDRGHHSPEMPAKKPTAVQQSALPMHLYCINFAVYDLSFCSLTSCSCFFYVYSFFLLKRKGTFHFLFFLFSSCGILKLKEKKNWSFVKKGPYQWKWIAVFQPVKHQIRQWKSKQRRFPCHLPPRKVMSTQIILLIAGLLPISLPKAVWILIGLP